MFLWRSRMMIRTILCLAALWAAGSGTLSAQDRFSKFQDKLEKSWDEIRPRGKLLQQFRDSFKSERNKSEGGQAAGKPTPATPPRVARQNPADDGSRLTARRGAEPNSNAPLSGNSGWPRQAQRGGEDRVAAGQPNQDPRNARNARSSRSTKKADRKTDETRDDRAASQANRRAPQPPVAESAPGAQPEAISLGVIVDEKRKNEDGIRILKVSRDSPADRAGLRNGDILVSIAGVETTELQILDELLAAFGPHDQVQIEYLRGKKPGKVMVSFSDEPLPTDEVTSDAPDVVFDDTSPAPLPPELPDLGEPNRGGDSSPGLISVLDEPRRAKPQVPANSRTPRVVPNAVYPSPQILPPVTGSSINTRPGGSIMREPTQKNSSVIPDKSLFQRLPPRGETRPPREEIEGAARPENAPAKTDDDAEMLEIELLSPDGD